MTTSGGLFAVAGRQLFCLVSLEMSPAFARRLAFRHRGLRLQRSPAWAPLPRRTKRTESADCELDDTIFTKISSGGGNRDAERADKMINAIVQKSGAHRALAARALGDASMEATRSLPDMIVLRNEPNRVHAAAAQPAAAAAAAALSRCKPRASPLTLHIARRPACGRLLRWPPFAVSAAACD